MEGLPRHFSQYAAGMKVRLNGWHNVDNAGGLPTCPRKRGRGGSRLAQTYRLAAQVQAYFTTVLNALDHVLNDAIVELNGKGLRR